jgi:mannosyltransferase OCH1-like enzyme
MTISSWITSVFSLATGALLLVFAWEITKILTANLAQTPRAIHIGQHTTLGSDSTTTIPKVLWTYWHQAPTPEFIAQCHANWQHFAPDHELRVVYQNNLSQWLDTDKLTKQFDQLPPYRQADWLRLKLLTQHGGIWIDASTLLSQNLEWVHTLQAEHSSEYVGFYIDRFTTRPEQPIVENWFMAAIPQSPFILALANEFDKAIEMSEDTYLRELHRNGTQSNVVQGLSTNDQLYLIMHVAASVVLNRSEASYRLSLIRAEDSALGFHAALGWKKRHLYARLALTPCPKQLPYIIKLRGGDRRVFEQGLSRGWLYKNSAVALLMEQSKSPMQ